MEDIGGSAKSLSVDRNALLDLDGVGGGDALRDVALLRGLGAPGCLLKGKVPMCHFLLKMSKK